MNLASEKQQIRQRVIAAREQLAPEVRAAHNVMITGRLLQMPEYRQAGCVLGYMNFGSEYASSLWVAQVLADGKRLALPKVNRHTNHLELYWVEDPENQLAAGLWGIREPVVERCKRLTTLNEVEFALLPGVAFTRCGARLGYGGGYYDKLLMKQPAIRPGEHTAPAKPVLSEVEGSLVMAVPNDESGVAHCPVLVAGAYSMQLVGHLPQEATDCKMEWLVTESETIQCVAPPGRGSKER